MDLLSNNKKNHPTNLSKLSGIFASRLRKIAKIIKNSNNLKEINLKGGNVLSEDFWKQLDPGQRSDTVAYIDCNNATRLKNILKTSRDAKKASETINKSKIKVRRGIIQGNMNVNKELILFTIDHRINKIFTPTQFSLVNNLCIKTKKEYDSCKLQFDIDQIPISIDLPLFYTSLNSNNHNKSIQDIDKNYCKILITCEVISLIATEIKKKNSE